MDFIPASAPHWHLLLNHFPSIGTVLALGLLLAALYRRSDELTRTSLVLFVVLALISIPTFVTGGAARSAIEDNPGVSVELIVEHQDAAAWALIWVLVTGWFSWFALWQYRRLGRPYGWSVPAVLVLGLITLAAMVRTGSLGGDINHPEIHTGGELEAASQTASWTGGIADWIQSTAWAWPTLEAAHFMGMAVLFGVVLLVALRVFGFVRHIPYAAFHRLLPLGVFGFMINVVTGMLFFVVDYDRYATMTNSFFPKMALIAIGGIAVLYFTIFDRPWALKPGDDAPVVSKVVAAATVLMWGGVIAYGRLLPYLEGAGG